MTRISRKFLILFSIVTILVLLTIAVILSRAWKEQYQWNDTPGTNIPLPDSVRGQRGFEACVSPDGRTIAVAGHPIMSQDVYNLRREPAIQLMAMKYYIYIGNSADCEFREVYHSLQAGMVLDMAFSPTSPHQLAFIAAEIPLQLCETMQELEQLAKDTSTRRKMAKEWGQAWEDARTGKYQISVYLLDIGVKSPAKPKKLCSLDIAQPQHRNPPAQRFSDCERGLNSLVWSPDGNSIYCKSDGATSLSKISLDGNKTKFYTSDDISFLFSNLHCDDNGDLVFLAGKKQIEGKDQSYNLIRVDKSGELLSDDDVTFFYPGTSYFDESIHVLTGHSHIAAIRMSQDDIHEAQLRALPLPLNLPDGEQERKASINKTVFHDPNHVQFYYLVKGFLPETNEVLIAKKRALHWYGKEKRVTPWNVSNQEAPWVELRKVKIPE